MIIVTDIDVMIFVLTPSNLVPFISTSGDHGQSLFPLS